jgi:hypothetical protein
MGNHLLAQGGQSGHGSGPLSAGTLVEKVVASSTARAKILNSFFTAGLLFVRWTSHRVICAIWNSVVRKIAAPFDVLKPEQTNFPLDKKNLRIIERKVWSEHPANNRVEL